MAKMIPNVRLLVVLRDPVARAHSEYHMKKRSHHRFTYILLLYLRRVDERNSFLRTMHRHSADVYKCVSLAVRFTSPVLLSELQRRVEYSCARVLPGHLTEAPLWRKFLAALLQHYQSNSKSWHRALGICFTAVPGALTSTVSGAHISLFDTATFSSRHVILNTSYMLQALAFSALSMPEKMVYNASTGDVVFHPQACMGRHVTERIGEEAQVFRDEVTYLTHEEFVQ